MTLPRDFKILAESRKYILGNVSEYGSIIEKTSGKVIYIGDSYGDPTFALIDKNEKWALLFGHDSYLWTPREKVKHLNKDLFIYEELFKWPYDARQVDAFEVEILDDPWSDNAAIFSFNIETNKIKRIKGFQKLEGRYSDYDKAKLSW